MGMSIGTLKAALELKGRGIFDGIDSVLDMGSQELHLGYDDFVHMCKSAGLNPDGDEFEKVRNFPDYPRCSTKFFWQLLGARSAVCSDINREHDSIYIDLNQPLNDPSLEGKFDLVTDFGNNEHVFNVGEAYRTMHRLCRKGGLLWINQRVYCGNGFFCFDQSFFEGLAAANRYGVVYSAYVVTSGANPLTNQFHIPASKELLECLDYGKLNGLGITYVFRKTENNAFSPYYQGNANRADERFLVQFIGNGYPLEKYYVPIGTSELIRSLSKRELADLAVQAIPELMRRIGRRLGIR